MSLCSCQQHSDRWFDSHMSRLLQKLPFYAFGLNYPDSNPWWICQNEVHHTVLTTFTFFLENQVFPSDPSGDPKTFPRALFLCFQTLTLSNWSCLITEHVITIGSSILMNAFFAHNTSVVISKLYNVSQMGHLKEDSCMNKSLACPLFSFFSLRDSSSKKAK